MPVEIDLLQHMADGAGRVFVAYWIAGEIDRATQWADVTMALLERGTTAGLELDSGSDG